MQAFRRIGYPGLAALAVFGAIGLATLTGPSRQPGDLPAADDTPAPSATVERIRVFGQSLAGNLMGEPADPYVSVFLPGSYDTSPDRRYPVVYLLHAFAATDQSWFGAQGIGADAAAIQAFERGTARETILVMPNCHNAYGGCMYSNSGTSGYWEDYIADDLAAAIDARYRTIPARESRGLAGHSMGGYGAIKIGMKRPDVFSAVYALSPCCLDETLPRAGEPARRLEAIQTPEDVRRNPGAQGTFARAAAWSPNPANPPFFLDLPTRDGELRPDVAARWAAHSPAALLDTYVPNLRTLSAIALDAGDQDQVVSMSSLRNLSAALWAYGIEHTFETYPGDHNSGIPRRIEENVLPFFSTHLSFEPDR